MDTNCDLQSFHEFTNLWKLYINIEQELLHVRVSDEYYKLGIGSGILIPYVDDQLNVLENNNIYVSNDKFLIILI